MRIPGSGIWIRPLLLGGWSGGGGAVPSVDSRMSRMVREQLKGMPDVRSDLVVLLRRAIEEDRYYVPEELVAERIICCLSGIFN